jgi:hypothetical protein
MTSPTHVVKSFVIHPQASAWYCRRSESSGRHVVGIFYAHCLPGELRRLLLQLNSWTIADTNGVREVAVVVKQCKSSVGVVSLTKKRVTA